MIVSKEVKICGNCRKFDIKDPSGNFIGKTNTKEGLVIDGVCRAQTEIIVEIVNSKTACVQPPGNFVQR